MSIGERIRSVRKARGLSQESLARGADISLNVVGKIENGVVRDPHISTLRGIAATLEVDIAELIEESVPLGEAPEAGRSEVQAPEQTDGAGPNVEIPQGKILLDDPQIVEWLREHGLAWGSTDDEVFRERVRGLNLEEVDEYGRSVTVMELGLALANEQVAARDFLGTPTKYRSLGERLPVDPDAPVADKKRQRREHLGKLRRELEKRYHRRAVALWNYASLLVEEKEIATVSSIFGPVPVATTPEAVWDEAWKGAA